MFNKIINKRPFRRLPKGIRPPGRRIVTPPIDLRLTPEQKLILRQISDWEKRSSKMCRMFDTCV